MAVPAALPEVAFDPGYRVRNLGSGQRVESLCDSAEGVISQQFPENAPGSVSAESGPRQGLLARGDDRGPDAALDRLRRGQQFLLCEQNALPQPASRGGLGRSFLETHDLLTLGVPPEPRLEPQKVVVPQAGPIAQLLPAAGSFGQGGRDPGERTEIFTREAPRGGGQDMWIGERWHGRLR
jgi:hypothetical protein